LNEVKEID